MANNSLDDSFKLLWEQKIPEISSKAIFYKHVKTQAEILFLQNEDDNKVFSIGFTTPAPDSTGVSHILEHAILAGSKKYPTKEPFVDLLKSSLYTFLNAMTFPDKTLYPVASQNEKDLENLMDVYLDAVFNPILSEKVFKQEGWHYELKNESDPLLYKGVVFNEMKGAIAEPDDVIEQYSFESLFSDNFYGFNAGGNPKVIPNLTYANFLQFYKKHYHPSNSKIYFYGNIDIEKALNHLQKYLKNYDYCETEIKIDRHPKFKNPLKIEKEYANTSKDKGLVVSAWAFSDDLTPLDRLGLEILNYALMESEASPLKNALLAKEKLGEELIDMGVEGELKNPVFITGLKGVKPQNFEKVTQTINKTLTALTKGINKDLIDSAINSVEFTRRERPSSTNYPKGLMYLRQIMQSWLYSRDPLENLKFENNLREIKKKDTKYFETLINDFFSKNLHRADIYITPDPELQEKNDAEEKKNLQKVKAESSQDNIKELIKETKELINWQNAPDTLENLRKIPQLHLNDIDQKIKEIQTKVELVEPGFKVLKHIIETNGIVYIDLGFDISNVPHELVPYLGLYSACITKLGTKLKNYEQVALEIDKHTGGIWNAIVVDRNIETKSLFAYMFFKTKIFPEKLQSGLGILQEILVETDFDQKERLKQIIFEEKSKLENAIVGSGHYYSLYNTLANLDIKYDLQNKFDYLEYYTFIKDLAKSYEKKHADIIKNIANLHKTLTSNNSIINLTAEEKLSQTTLKEIKKIYIKLPSMQTKTPNRLFEHSDLEYKRNAFTISSGVNYVATAYDLAEAEIEPHGSQYVLNKILHTDYLWNRVRVQGGAYGALPFIDIEDKIVGFASYRDPNIIETLKTYQEIGHYLSTKDFTPEELERFIISAIGLLDRYKTPSKKGWDAMIWHLKGMTLKIRQKRREELLDTKVENIRKFGKALTKLSSKTAPVTVLGNKQKINAAKELVGLEVLPL